MPTRCRDEAWCWLTERDCQRDANVNARRFRSFVDPPGVRRDRFQRANLDRSFAIASFRIRYMSVVRGSLSRAATPCGPDHAIGFLNGLRSREAPSHKLQSDLAPPEARSEWQCRRTPEPRLGWQVRKAMRRSADRLPYFDFRYLVVLSRTRPSAASASLRATRTYGASTSCAAVTFEGEEGADHQKHNRHAGRTPAL